MLSELSRVFVLKRSMREFHQQIVISALFHIRQIKLFSAPFDPRTPRRHWRGVPLLAGQERSRSLHDFSFTILRPTSLRIPHDVLADVAAGDVGELTLKHGGDGDSVQRCRLTGQIDVLWWPNPSAFGDPMHPGLTTVNRMDDLSEPPCQIPAAHAQRASSPVMFLVRQDKRRPICTLCF